MAPVTPRPWADALAWADASPAVADTETVPLAEAAGRVTADDVTAGDDLPAGRLAASDGYALRAAQTYGAGDYNPLPVAATVVRDGDPLPAGADTVVPLELAEAGDGVVYVTRPQAVGDHVAEPGEQWAAGTRLVAAGTRLRPAHLGLLALAGLAEVAVRRRPLVRLVAAGRFGRDADTPMLAALVRRDGGVVDAAAGSVAEALTRPGADLVLVSGGTGDDSAEAVSALGAAGRVDVHRTTIHPGGAVALGRVGAVPVVALPGTPLACFAAYDLIAGRLVRRLAGLAPGWPYRTVNLSLTAKIASTIGRLELARVRLRDGRAEPIAVADGRRLASVTEADGFTIVDEPGEGFPAGAIVTVYLYD
jgi:molybdopterin molybdotransferase